MINCGGAVLKRKEKPVIKICQSSLARESGFILPLLRRRMRGSEGGI